VNVYIELVIFNNLFIDLLLILATLTIKKRKFKPFRIASAAVFGAACAVIYPLVPDFAEILIKILLAPLLTLIFLPIKGDGRVKKLGDYVGALIAFMLLTYLVGGTVYGLSYALKVDVNSYATLGLCALSASIMLIAARVIVRKRALSSKTVCQSTVTVGEREIVLNSLCDSGNMLVDSDSGLPVIILSENAEKDLQPKNLMGFINVKTVSGEDSLPIVKLDEVKVRGKSYEAIGALSRKTFEDYDVILQSSMF